MLKVSRFGGPSPAELPCGFQGNRMQSWGSPRLGTACWGLLGLETRGEFVLGLEMRWGSSGWHSCGEEGTGGVLRAPARLSFPPLLSFWKDREGSW